MLRFGVFLIIIGFGSSILHFTGYQFRIVGWTEEWQPGLGFAIGGAGVLICALVGAFRKGDDEQVAPQQPFAYPPGQPHPPRQQFAAEPTQQFTQPPRQPFRQATAPYPPQPPRQGPVPQFPPRPSHTLPAAAAPYGQQGGHFPPQSR